MKISHETPLVMVTGVARSGTTLLASCLNNHPEILCARDPMNELFKGFVHFAYYKITGEKKSADYPIDHFFFSGNLKVSQFLEETDFSHEIPNFLKRDLLERITRRGGHYCPVLKDSVAKLAVNRFDELLLEILSILHQDSKKGDCAFYGFKDAWCEQLILPLSKTFPHMKFMTILRDPRAVISSNYSSNSQYPLFLSIRDWRKSVYYSWKFQFSDSRLKDRFIYLKYEDLINNPVKTLDQVAHFLGFPSSEEMLNKPFRRPNSSYEEVQDSGQIVKPTKERWREYLPLALCDQIELYCLPEMRKVGYEPRTTDQSTKYIQALFGEQVAYEKLGNWCKKLVPQKWLYATVWRLWHTVIEFARLLVYRFKTKSRRIRKKLFYDQKYHQWLRES